MLFRHSLIHFPLFTLSPLAHSFLPHSLYLHFPSLILSLLALPSFPVIHSLSPHSFILSSLTLPSLIHSSLLILSSFPTRTHSFLTNSPLLSLIHLLSSPFPSFPPFLHSPLTHPPSSPLSISQVMDMDSERHRFVVSLCCSDLRHSNTGDPVADGDWREILVGHLKRYLRQKVEAESGRTAHPIGAVRRAKVCESSWDTDVAHVWGMWHMFGGCGTCLGGCSACLGDVVHVWGMWHWFGDVAHVWGYMCMFGGK